jgi:hypothetical protein
MALPAAFAAAASIFDVAVDEPEDARSIGGVGFCCYKKSKQ